MFITVDGVDYELNTKLGTAAAIEKRFNVSLNQLFDKLESATIEELADMICVAKAEKEPGFKAILLQSDVDYIGLFDIVQNLVVNLMFSGTDEQKEAKIDKFPTTDESKNAMRALLGLPAKETPASTGDN